VVAIRTLRHGADLALDGFEAEEEDGNHEVG